MKNIYRLALQVQDASNINGVVNSLHTEIIPAIRLEAGYREQGMKYLAQHPAFLLFMDKLVSMTGVMYTLDEEGALSRAYDKCKEMADAEVSTQA